jgi:hypothetical protein
MPQMKVDLQKATENAAETFCGLTQKEGMGPLEYQTMPFLRVVAQDGVLCTFSNRSAQVVWFVWAGGMDRPSRTKSHPAGSLSSSQPDGPPCRASPLAFGLIGPTVF